MRKNCFCGSFWSLLNSSWFSDWNYFGSIKANGEEEEESLWQVCTKWPDPMRIWTVEPWAGQLSSVSFSTPWGAGHDLPETAWCRCELWDLANSRAPVRMWWRVPCCFLVSWAVVKSLLRTTVLQGVNVSHRWWFIMSWCSWEETLSRSPLPFPYLKAPISKVCPGNSSLTVREPCCSSGSCVDPGLPTSQEILYFSVD